MIIFLSWRWFQLKHSWIIPTIQTMPSPSHQFYNIWTSLHLNIVGTEHHWRRLDLRGFHFQDLVSSCILLLFFPPHHLQHQPNMKWMQWISGIKNFNRLCFGCAWVLRDITFWFVGFLTSLLLYIGSMVAKLLTRCSVFSLVRCCSRGLYGVSLNTYPQHAYPCWDYYRQMQKLYL